MAADGLRRVLLFLSAAVPERCRFRALAAGSPVSVGEQPGPLAILPGGIASAGGTLYVVNTGSGSVTPISTATNEAGLPIPVGYLPTSIAISG
jgi:YVTN family beta-propeller protein